MATRRCVSYKTKRIAELPLSWYEMTLFQRLSYMRHSRRLTIADVSRMTGLCYHHVWEIETGRKPKVGWNTVVLIAAAVDVSLDSLAR